MTEEELGAIRTGAKLQNFAPYIEADLDKMKKAVVNRVMMAINQNAFNPDIALSMWHEYVALERLAQRINQKIRVGESLNQKEEEE